MANWRFSLFGMSFLPPPGMFMAAKYLQQILVGRRHDASDKKFYEVHLFLGSETVLTYPVDHRPGDTKREVADAPPWKASHKAWKQNMWA